MLLSWHDVLKLFDQIFFCFLIESPKHFGTYPNAFVFPPFIQTLNGYKTRNVLKRNRPWSPCTTPTVLRLTGYGGRGLMPRGPITSGQILGRVYPPPRHALCLRNRKCLRFLFLIGSARVAPRVHRTTLVPWRESSFPVICLRRPPQRQTLPSRYIPAVRIFTTTIVIR